MYSIDFRSSLFCLLALHVCLHPMLVAPVRMLSCETIAKKRVRSFRNKKKKRFAYWPWQHSSSNNNNNRSQIRIQNWIDDQDSWRTVLVFFFFSRISIICRCTKTLMLAYTRFAVERKLNFKLTISELIAISAFPGSKKNRSCFAYCTVQLWFFEWYLINEWIWSISSSIQ